MRRCRLEGIDFQTVTVDVFLIEVAMSGRHKRQVRDHLRRHGYLECAIGEIGAPLPARRQPKASARDPKPAVLIDRLAQSHVCARAEGGGVPAALRKSRARRQCSGAGRWCLSPWQAVPEVVTRLSMLLVLVPQPSATKY